MKKSATILSLVSVVACASGGANPSTPGAREATRVTSGSQITIDRVDDGSRVKAIANAPIADVWRQLPFVLDSLGVKVATMNPTTYDIGNTGFDVGRQLGGTIVTKYFDCAAGGAMSLDLHVSVIVHLEAASPLTTNLLTQVTVKGKPITYSSGWVNCSSTGILERRIAEGVNAHLKR